MAAGRRPSLVRRAARRLAAALDADVEAAGDRRPAPRVLFVLGSQRSGTNALRRCISLSPAVAGHNEVEHDRWYERWRLRPEADIGDLVRREWAPNVLFKPIVNLLHERLDDLLDQWRDHDAQVAWIYRDPVDVHQSRVTRWPGRADVSDFLAEWHHVNRQVVDAVADDGRIAIVRYEDLTTDGAVLWSLFRRLGITGENLFRDGPSKGRARLDPSVVAHIDEATAALLGELDARRTFVPTTVGAR